MGGIRLDKYLANLGITSRKNIKKFVKYKLILINGKYAKTTDQKINLGDNLLVKGRDKIYSFKVLKNFVVLLYKPIGYICSDIDENGYWSYKRLLQDCPYNRILKIAGRLDVNAEGLVVLSDNGNLIHRLISPKGGKEKVYYVRLVNALTDNDIKKLERGVNIGDYITMPAKIYRLTDKNVKKLFVDKSTLSQISDYSRVFYDDFLYNSSVIIVIKEGKFHQIKRMVKSVGNKVKCLKRLKVGNYELGDLKPKQWLIVGGEKI